MPHKRTPQEICAGKVRFTSRKRALTRLNWVRNHSGPRPGRTGLPTDVYHCRVCHGWHMTSKPQDGRKAP